MISDSNSQLTALCTEIERRDDSAFLASLFIFLERINDDAWCRAAAAELRTTETVSVERFRTAAAEVAAEIGTLCAELDARLRSVAAAPPAGTGAGRVGRDMGAARDEPAEDDEDEYDPETLHQCTALLSNGDDALRFSPGQLPEFYSRTRKCLRALRTAADSDRTGVSFDDLDKRVAALEARYETAWRRRFIDAKVGAGAALTRIEDVIGIVGKTAPRTSQQEGLRQVALMHGGLQELEEFLFGYSSNSTKSGEYTARVRRLRGDFRTAWVGLQGNLTGTLSLLNAINRYRMRCQWYDAAALRQLAAQRKRTEDRLAEHAARFLFDQGLAPLLWPFCAGLEPDLLVPPTGEGRWSVYLEAKQYQKTNTNYLRQGVWEMEDHLTRLAGSPYAPSEGFYVVFRRGGAQYRFPSSLTIGRIRVYPLVVDIAESKTSGSRQAEAPITLTEDYLLSRPQRRGVRRPSSGPTAGKGK